LLLGIVGYVEEDKTGTDWEEADRGEKREATRDDDPRQWKWILDGIAAKSQPISVKSETQ